MRGNVQEEWRIYGKKADFAAIGERFHISPVTARLLRNRDVIGDEAIWRYLNGGPESFYPPEQMKDMETAVKLLLQAVQDGRPIRIIGDYDADGVCSIAVLYRCLQAVHARVDWTIPDRIRDGYGLNRTFVEEAAADGISLLLTCDNGIAAREEIALAKKLGLQVVVTDHHELPRGVENGEERPLLPPADAVVNPKRPDCPYPYKGLCGAAIAWKLAGLLLTRAGVEAEQRKKLMGELLEYAAIATVTDVCNLVDENRILVKEGLRRLRCTAQPGLAALMECQRIHPESLSAYHIGFVIGPALNAGGRLATARTAVELLLTREREPAERLAAELKELNDRRKEMTIAGAKEAEQVIEETGLADDRVLVVYLPECHESLAGIIAGRIREAYGKPTIVLTKGKDGLKGSGRSIEAYHMFRGLSECAEYLTRFGGHPMAAGLSLREEDLDAFRAALNARCTLTEADLTQKVWIDLVLPFEYIDRAFLEELQLLEPFGKGNTKPVFAERGLEILSMRLIGKNRNVLRMTLRNASGTQMEAVCFQDCEQLLAALAAHYGELAVRQAESGRTNPLRLHITYYPELDTYGGRERLQIVVTRWKLPQ